MTTTQWLQRFGKSFMYAGRGIIDGLQERTMKVHLVALISVILLGVLVDLNQTEWIAILLCIGGVISLELVNTSLEELADLIRDTQHLPYSATRRARDVAAGAVFVMAIVSACIAALIFLPKLF